MASADACEWDVSEISIRNRWESTLEDSEAASRFSSVAIDFTVR